MKLIPVIIVAILYYFFGSNVNVPFDDDRQGDSSNTDTAVITLLFSGDVMQHMPQINASWSDSLKNYNYDSCFQPFAGVFNLADVSVINLETTLAGEPYSGYPQFSAPDALIWGLKKAGVDVLVTANNHTCDKGKKGILRTLEMIDSCGLKRTGSFADSADHKRHNPLIINEKGIRIALLNYTYGTNGIAIPAPAIVNLIDTAVIRKDFEKARGLEADIIVPFFHWGIEYQREPNDEQKNIADFCLSLGTTLVIGSHPHVVQPVQRYLKNTDSVTVCWSLGNFVSNQRQLHTDGGMSLLVEITRTGEKTFVSKAAYILHWVSIETTPSGKKSYRCLPVIPEIEYSGKMKDFAGNTRSLIDGYTSPVKEMKYDTLENKWLWPY